MIKKISLAFITFIIFFIIIDSLLNAKFPPLCTVYQPDKLLEHSLVPNKVCTERTDEYSVEYKINSLGFRDNEITYAKPPNTFRILFLGDSFTQGYGVDLADTFVKRIELILNQNFKDKHFETINAGVSAYTSLNEYLMLKYRGLQLKPDLIVLNVNATDFIEQRALLKQVKIDKNGDVSFANLQRKKYLPGSIDKFLLDHSFLYNWFVKNQENLVRLKGKIIAFLLRQKPPDYTKTSSDFTLGDPDHDIFAITENIPEAEFNDLFKPVVNQLDKIVEILFQKNIPFVLTYIPHGHQIGSNQWVKGRVVRKLTDSVYPDILQAKLKDYADSRGIYFIDMTNDLRKFANDNPDKKLYFDYDGHFNVLGQQLSAQAITNFLMDNQEWLSPKK